MTDRKMCDPEVELPEIILRVRGNGANGDGEHVASFKSLAVAMMNPPPEIMLWGQRAFIFKHKRKDEALVYVEGMPYPLIPGVTAEEVTT